MRQMMRESLTALEQGRDPLCIVRDPAKQRITFPQKSSMMGQKQADADYTLGFVATRSEVPG
jgi:hypothetical protein